MLPTLHQTFGDHEEYQLQRAFAVIRALRGVLRFFGLLDELACTHTLGAEGAGRIGYLSILSHEKRRDLLLERQGEEWHVRFEADEAHDHRAVLAEEPLERGHNLSSFKPTNTGGSNTHPPVSQYVRVLKELADRRAVINEPSRLGDRVTSRFTRHQERGVFGETI